MTPSVSAALQAELHDFYRHLHSNPELSMQEHQTAKLVSERLDGMGYTTTRCAETGVVAWLSNGPGPVVAFRADLDGLPVAEETGLDYASAVRGMLADGSDVPVMHACGHDVHITCLVGAATLMAENKESWSGTLVLIFQPAEETATGALAMVEDGLWDKAPSPEVIYGQHVGPSRAGTLQISRGPAMAVADAWKVTVHGRGGHGSRPEQTIDPVLLAAHIIVRLQSVVTRESSAQSPSVITVGTFHAGYKENIIPGTAEFSVNMRHLDETVRTRVLAAARRVIAAEAAASGAPEPTIEELYTFPLTLNDHDVIEEVIATVTAEFGADRVEISPAQMGSEDFSNLVSHIDVPSAYWFFGGLSDDVIDGDEPLPANHSANFGPVIEPTISTGLRAACAVLLSRLGRGT